MVIPQYLILEKKSWHFICTIYKPYYTFMVYIKVPWYYCLIPSKSHSIVIVVFCKVRPKHTLILTSYLFRDSVKRSFTGRAEKSWHVFGSISCLGLCDSLCTASKHLRKFHTLIITIQSFLVKVFVFPFWVPKRNTFLFLCSRIHPH